MKKLRLDQIIVGHGRQEKNFNTRFIIFLLGVIIFCLLVIVTG